MRGKFLVVLLVLILCLPVSSQFNDIETSSEDLEKELRETLWKLALYHRDTQFAK